MFQKLSRQYHHQQPLRSHFNDMEFSHIPYIKYILGHQILTHICRLAVVLVYPCKSLSGQNSYLLVLVFHKLIALFVFHVFLFFSFHFHFSKLSVFFSRSVEWIQNQLIFYKFRMLLYTIVTIAQYVRIG